MKKFYSLQTKMILLLAFIMIGCMNLPAQKPAPADDNPTSVSEELRPFDFNDDHYVSNGINPRFLINRRSGMDKFSTLDISRDSKHNNVRVLAAHSAYGHNGEILFWNFYGEFYKNAFTRDAAGQAAYNMAYNFPIYIFPGTGRTAADRQSPVIDLTPDYFQKNILGLGIVMMVRYNAAITPEDRAFLENLAIKNGVSADGSPVIKTVRELDQLGRRNLVTITERAAERGTPPAFIAGKVIEYPKYGGVTYDAFLVDIKGGDGNTLASEMPFTTIFECLRVGGRSCL